MKVAVVGAGAMGSLYASMLHDAGNEVVLVDVNRDVVSAITARGATITRRDGRVDVYPILATSDPRALARTVDLVLFQVKGFATAAATELARPLVGPDTAVITLQNGLGNDEVLRAAYPDNPVLVGISVHSVAMTAPGEYLHSGTRSTSLGPAEEHWFPHAERAAAAFHGSGYEVHLEHAHAIRREVFAKWVLNCGSLPVTALTLLPTDEFSRHEPSLRLCDALTHEACDLAAAEGVMLEPEERTAFNRGLFRTAGGRSSMVQDIEAGRRTEIDTISGAAARLADKHGIPAPLNRAMLALVKGREAAMGIPG